MYCVWVCVVLVIGIIFEYLCTSFFCFFAKLLYMYIYIYIYIYIYVYRSVMVFQLPQEDSFYSYVASSHWQYLLLIVIYVCTIFTGKNKSIYLYPLPFCKSQVQVRRSTSIWSRKMNKDMLMIFSVTLIFDLSWKLFILTQRVFPESLPQIHSVDFLLSCWQRIFF